MRRWILKSLLLVDRKSQGKRQLQAWKVGIKLVQELRIARLFWNIALPQRVGATPTRPQRLDVHAEVKPAYSMQSVFFPKNEQYHIFTATIRTDWPLALFWASPVHPTLYLQSAGPPTRLVCS